MATNAEKRIKLATIRSDIGACISGTRLSLPLHTGDGTFALDHILAQHCARSKFAIVESSATNVTNPPLCEEVKRVCCDSRLVEVTDIRPTTDDVYIWHPRDFSGSLKIEKVGKKLQLVESSVNPETGEIISENHPIDHRDSVLDRLESWGYVYVAVRDVYGKRQL